jgi:hypothetical protein
MQATPIVSKDNLRFPIDPGGCLGLESAVPIGIHA